jgi:hypothetical protein
LKEVSVAFPEFILYRVLHRGGRRVVFAFRADGRGGVFFCAVDHVDDRVYAIEELECCDTN